MSAAKSGKQVLYALSREGLRRLQKPKPTFLLCQSRAASSTPRRPKKLCRVAVPGTCSNNMERMQEMAQAMKTVTARRGFSASSAVAHGDWSPPKPGKELFVTFVDKDGDEFKIAVNKGDNLLTIAQANDIEMEGACEGSCSCSTCHVIVENEQMYDKMEEATDDENDMLDLAFGLTETSRLGCQIEMTEELDGLRVRLPSMTRNLQASDFEKRK